MLYCEKCCNPFEEGARCPLCSSRKVRELNESDPCLLVEEEPMWVEMIEDILKDHQVPYVVRPANTAWVGAIAGSRFLRRQFLVPWSYMPQAQELLQSLFNAQPVEEEETP